jgi:hypothetical protein
MREICTSGLTRGTRVTWSLLYREGDPARPRAIRGLQRALRDMERTTDSGTGITLQRHSPRVDVAIS